MRIKKDFFPVFDLQKESSKIISSNEKLEINYKQKMNIKKVFLINSEKSERTTIYRKSKRIALKGFCKTCGTQVEWQTSSEISRMLQENDKKKPEIENDNVPLFSLEED